MDTIEYEGYRGSVRFSADDRVLHGRLLGINDVMKARTAPWCSVISLTNDCSASGSIRVIPKFNAGAARSWPRLCLIGSGKCLAQ